MAVAVLCWLGCLAGRADFLDVLIRLFFAEMCGGTLASEYWFSYSFRIAVILDMTIVIFGYSKLTYLLAGLVPGAILAP